MTWKFAAAGFQTRAGFPSFPFAAAPLMRKSGPEPLPADDSICP